MTERIGPPALPAVAHFLGGLLASFVSEALPLAALFVFAGFFIYEIIEFVNLHDSAWKDIREFVVGLALGAAARYLLGLLGVT